MIATVGRSARFGERSRGSPDPGRDLVRAHRRRARRERLGRPTGRDPGTSDDPAHRHELEDEPDPDRGRRLVPGVRAARGGPRRSRPVRPAAVHRDLGRPGAPARHAGSPGAPRTSTRTMPVRTPGDVSAPMLADLGCRYVEVGHSERRRDHGETPELIAAKVAAILRWGMTPILCVGEARDGPLEAVGPLVLADLDACLAGVAASRRRADRGRLRAGLGDRRRGGGGAGGAGRRGPAAARRLAPPSGPTAGRRGSSTVVAWTRPRPAGCSPSRASTGCSSVATRSTPSGSRGSPGRGRSLEEGRAR